MKVPKLNLVKTDIPPAAFWGREAVYALATVFLAWSLTFLLRIIVPDRPLSLVLFFAAVAVSAGRGGLRAGVLATVLSALACDYFFLTPRHSFAVAASDLPLLVLFIAAALLINGLSGRLHARTQQADQRYYQLVQGLDGIVWEAHPRTLQFTFVSRRAEMLLGYPVHQWLSTPDFRARITHPDDYEHMREVWHEAIMQEGERTEEYRARTIDGRELWFRETVYAVRDSKGRPIRMSGLCIDITARKAEAAELLRMKDDLAILNEINAALSASLQLPDFQCALQEQLNKHLDVTAGCLFLADDLSEALQPVTAWGTVTDFTIDWHSLSRATVDNASDSAEAEALTLQKAVVLPATPTQKRAGWSEVIAIPLSAEEKLHGGLCLFRRDKFGSDLNRLAFYDTLGRQIGTLLQNVTLFREVRAGRERLHHLSRQLVNVQEAERRAISRELHDEIGQALTGLKLTLEMSANLPAHTQAEQTRKALDLVSELMKQVEKLSLDLRPTMLDDLGLLPALLWHCERYTAFTGIQVHIEHRGLEIRLPSEVEVTAYRIIQEALTNVARHAEVTEATVRLWCTKELIGIQITDQGDGFDTESAAVRKAAGGLSGMRERAALLSGHLVVESAPGAGTSITAELPLPAENGIGTEDRFDLPRADRNKQRVGEESSRQCLP